MNKNLNMEKTTLAMADVQNVYMKLWKMIPLFEENQYTMYIKYYVFATRKEFVLMDWNYKCCEVNIFL